MTENLMHVSNDFVLAGLVWLIVIVVYVVGIPTIIRFWKWPRRK